MKTRTKRNVVYHATPENHWCFMAHSEVLNNKFKRGTITQDELSELATFRAKNATIKGELVSSSYKLKETESHPKEVEVTIFGTLKMMVPWNEYVRDYQPKGF